MESAVTWLCWWFHLLGKFLFSYNTIFPLLLELLGSYSKDCCPVCHVSFMWYFLVLSFSRMKIWVQGHWKNNLFRDGQCTDSSVHCWHCICSRSSKKSIKATRTLWNVCLVLQILRSVPRFSQPTCSPWIFLEYTSFPDHNKVSDCLLLL